jgi:hypothetical protein
VSNAATVPPVFRTRILSELRMKLSLPRATSRSPPHNQPQTKFSTSRAAHKLYYRPVVPFIYPPTSEGTYRWAMEMTVVSLKFSSITRSSSFAES